MAISAGRRSVVVASTVALCLVGAVCMMGISDEMRNSVANTITQDLAAVVNVTKGAVIQIAIGKDHKLRVVPQEAQPQPQPEPVQPVQPVQPQPAAVVPQQNVVPTITVPAPPVETQPAATPEYPETSAPTFTPTLTPTFNPTLDPARTLR